MGDNQLKEQQLFIELILQLLNRREIKVKKASVQFFWGAQMSFRKDEWVIRRIDGRHDSLWQSLSECDVHF